MPKLIALLALLVIPAAAQPAATGLEEARLVAPDRSQNAFFGQAVALSSDRALVGAAVDGGPVYVFARSGDGWSLEAELLPEDGVTGSAFGDAIALDGDVAVVGAQQANVDGTLAGGAVYVFVHSGGAWGLDERLTASEPQNFDLFGSTVALAGDLLLVGAQGDGPTKSGTVTAFSRTDSGWQNEGLVEATELAAQFGSTLAMTETRAIVAAFGEDDNPENGPFGSGIAFVFVRTSGGWEQEAKLTVPGRSLSNSVLFSSAALTDDRIALGALGEDDQQGVAYVYGRSGSEWSLAQRIVSPDPIDNGSFGAAVALDERLLYIGESSRGIGAGAESRRTGVYLFGRSGDAWEARGVIRPDADPAEDGFGNSLALSGPRLLVGASGEGDGAQDNAGAAYVFTDLQAVTAEHEPMASSWTLSAPWPNPANGQVAFTLQVDEQQRVRVSVLDPLGRAVLALGEVEIASTATMQVETETLAPGVYTIRVAGASGTASQRLTVIR